MTEEEIENNAKEYVKANICGWYDYCKDCINQNYRRIKDMCYPSKWVVNAYTNAYKQGQEHGLSMHLNIIVDDYKKENEELKWEQKQILEDNENYQKENEKLKNELFGKNEQLEKMKCCKSEILQRIDESCIGALNEEVRAIFKKWELAE